MDPQKADESLQRLPACMKFTTRIRHSSAAAKALCELLDSFADTQAWMKDMRGRYVWVNQAFLINYGLKSQKEVVGKSDYELSPAHLAAYFEEGDQAVLAGRPVKGRLELVGRYDHSAHWCRTTKLPMAAARGRPCGTVGFTHKLAASELEERMDISLGSVVATMVRKLDRKISNAELAKGAGTSARGLERAFLRDYGLSPQQYLRRLRMQTACQLLVDTRSSLAQISGKCGFADQSHFTREFRRLTGLTPRAYRITYASTE